MSGRFRKQQAGLTVGATLVGAITISLTGCGTGKPPSAVDSASRPEPQYAPENTREEQLVEQGAPLIVSYGCAACHLGDSNVHKAPSFLAFAGRRVLLTDGHRSLVNERFLRDALLHPARNPIKGYDPAPMVKAMRRLHLSSHPEQLAALVAFIEEVGPEAESG